MNSSAPALQKEIRYEPDERPPNLVSLGLGFQLVLLSISGIVLTPAIIIRAAGGEEAYQPVAKVGRSHTADIKWRYVYGKETVSGTATADVGGDGETASKSGTSLLRAVEPGAGESRV